MKTEGHSNKHSPNYIFVNLFQDTFENVFCCIIYMQIKSYSKELIGIFIKKSDSIIELKLLF